MRHAVPLAVLFTICALVASAAPPAKTITVTATGGPGDRPAIQAAINAAGKNDTVELVGTFVLDGTPVIVTRGDLTIAGREIDNDSDGAVNEDWADGADNDGDGATDEDGWDARLMGILAPDGRPDEVSLSRYNRGIVFEGFGGVERNITVRGIEFSGLVRGVQFGVDVIVPEGAACDAIVATNGSVNNSTVTGNHFTNSVRGVQIFGTSDHVTIRDNLATNIRRSTATANAASYPVLLVGGSFFCDNGTPGGSGFPIGSPRRTQIFDNTLVGNEWGGIRASGPVGETNVQRNRVVDGSRWGILFGRQTEKTLVQHNTVTGFLEGIDVGGVDSHVQNNTVLNSRDIGIVLFSTASGNNVVNNTIEGFGFVGIFLGGNTSSNRIRLNGKLDIADVLDLGTDNDVKK